MIHQVYWSAELNDFCDKETKERVNNFSLKVSNADSNEIQLNIWWVDPNTLMYEWMSFYSGWFYPSISIKHIYNANEIESINYGMMSHINGNICIIPINIGIMNEHIMSKQDIKTKFEIMAKYESQSSSYPSYNFSVAIPVTIKNDLKLTLDTASPAYNLNLQRIDNMNEGDDPTAVRHPPRFFFNSNSIFEFSIFEQFDFETSYLKFLPDAKTTLAIDTDWRHDTAPIILSSCTHDNENLYKLKFNIDSNTQRFLDAINGKEKTSAICEIKTFTQKYGEQVLTFKVDLYNRIITSTPIPPPPLTQWVQEAPNDANDYVRNNNEWKLLPPNVGDVTKEYVDTQSNKKIDRTPYDRIQNEKKSYINASSTVEYTSIDLTHETEKGVRLFILQGYCSHVMFFNGPITPNIVFKNDTNNNLIINYCGMSDTLIEPGIYYEFNPNDYYNYIEYKDLQEKLMSIDMSQKVDIDGMKYSKTLEVAIYNSSYNTNITTSRERTLLIITAYPAPELCRINNSSYKFYKNVILRNDSGVPLNVSYNNHTGILEPFKYYVPVALGNNSWILREIFNDDLQNKLLSMPYLPPHDDQMYVMKNGQWVVYP